VQPLLDAVVDYLPSPLDTKETRGLDPDNGKELVRKADDKDPFARWLSRSWPTRLSVS